MPRRKTTDLPELIPLEKLANIEFIQSSEPTVNVAIGGGGIPRIGVTEMYGVESGGKSTIALTFLPEVYVDVERSLDPVWAHHFVPGMQVAKPDNLNQAFRLIETILASEPRCLILDSLGGGVTEAEEKAASEGRGQPASQAQLTSQWLRLLVNSGRLDRTALLIVNQLRTSFSPYGPPTTTPGGRLLHHLALMRINVARTEWLEVGDRKVGQCILLRVTKSKVGVPWSEGEVFLGFNGKFYGSKEELREAAKKRRGGGASTAA